MSLPRSSSFTPLGSTAAAWFPEPLRDLDDPKATYGHAVIAFARNVCRTPLDPWEEWLVLRCGELTGDNLPRFRQILTIVARQNGKSFLLRVLAAFWLFARKYALVVGVANKLDMALESWNATVKLARSRPVLDKRIAKVITGNGKERLETVDGCRYLVSAAGKDAARGYTVDRAVWDEVRQEHDYETHSALLPTMSAVVDAQLFMISNMGTDSSVVLNDTIDVALRGDDPTLGAFLWWADPDCDPQDPAAHAAANPNLGIRVQPDELAAAAARAVSLGGEPLARFKQERLCIRTKVMDAAVDSRAWERCRKPGTLDDAKDRVRACVDVSLDGLHCTFSVAAELPDGRVRVEVVRSWEGRKCMDEAAADLPTLLDRIHPRSIGWFPNGPGTAMGPVLAKFPNVQPLKDLPAVCMSFAEAVDGERVVHSGQPLLDTHVGAAEKLRTGDRWVFSRKGSGGVDALYSVAGATFLVRSGPPKLRTVLPTPLH